MDDRENKEGREKSKEGMRRIKGRKEGEGKIGKKERKMGGVREEGRK